jgi:hypothetical protein
MFGFFTSASPRHGEVQKCETSGGRNALKGSLCVPVPLWWIGRIIGKPAATGRFEMPFTSATAHQETSDEVKMGTRGLCTLCGFALFSPTRIQISPRLINRLNGYDED